MTLAFLSSSQWLEVRRQESWGFGDGHGPQRTAWGTEPGREGRGVSGGLEPIRKVELGLDVAVASGSEPLVRRREPQQEFGVSRRANASKT